MDQSNFKRFIADHGVCLTFNAEDQTRPPLLQKEPGVRYGLSLVLNPHLDIRTTREDLQLNHSYSNLSLSLSLSLSPMRASLCLSVYLPVRLHMHACM